MHQIAAPTLIVSTMASVDGRITTGRQERLLDPEPRARWEQAWPADVPELLARRDAAIEAAYRPTVILEGSGTFVGPEAKPLPGAGRGLDADTLIDDFLPHRTPTWFVVVDGRGRVPWQFRGDDQRALLVLVCRATPLGYLAGLREQQIPYLVVGTEQVDLAGAMTKLGEQLGAAAIVSEGGGGINGALLRAGLVDELHVITIPALVGGADTPSMFDGAALPAGARIPRLVTAGVQVGEHGTTWIHYVRR